MVFVFFILGLFVGSFLNVAILRMGTGLSVASGRSQCFSCGKNLHWFELIPLLSFIFQSGKCLKCKSKISLQYPVVELVTATLFALVYYTSFAGDLIFSSKEMILAQFVATLAVFSVLIVISVYDLRHKIIPDNLSVLFVIFSFFIAASRFSEKIYFFEFAKWMDLFSGIILFVPFYLLWKFSGGRWIGLGDGKLAIGMGTFLGFSGGLSAVVIGFWSGAIFALGVMLYSNIVKKYSLERRAFNLTMKSEIPFAPFLILGTMFVYFTGVDVFSLGLLGF